MRYEQLANGVIFRPNVDGSESYIPPATANSDYRDYLAWVAAGNKAPIRPEPKPVVVPDSDAELVAAITAATTLAQLQAALLGSRGGRVKARPGA